MKLIYILYHTILRRSVDVAYDFCLYFSGENPAAMQRGRDGSGLGDRDPSSDDTPVLSSEGVSLHPFVPLVMLAVGAAAGMTGKQYHLVGVLLLLSSFTTPALNTSTTLLLLQLTSVIIVVGVTAIFFRYCSYPNQHTLSITSPSSILPVKNENLLQQWWKALLYS